MENREVFLAELKADIYELEQTLNLETGFFEGLTKQNDWAFIIQSHTLLETTTNQLIIEILNNSKVNRWVSFLHLNGKSGKISLLKQLNEIGNFDRKFIDALSKLRNEAVHNIEHNKFNLKTYLEGLNEEEKTQQLKALSYYYIEPDTPNSVDLQLIITSPKKTIINGLTLLLAIFMNKLGRFSAKNYHYKQMIDFGEVALAEKISANKNKEH